VTRPLLLLLLLLGAAGAQARTAAQEVIGDAAGSCDCPAGLTPKPTQTPLPPTPTPQPSATPINPVRQDIEQLGFPVQWEGNTLLVTLADESTRFDNAQATLKPASIERVQALAAVLVRYPGNSLRVDGHTDSGGQERFNRKLSLARAKAVADLLILRGVPESAFSAVEGHGPDQPVGDNSTEEGRASNRRVELRLSFHELAAPAAVGGSNWVSGTAASMSGTAASLSGTAAPMTGTAAVVPTLAPTPAP
jgi:outer membrane protein OmpA-like peptidoglycan-associated protein